MREFKHTEFVEAYLEDQLQGEKLEQFESQLAHDKELSELVSQAKLGHQVIGLAAREELRTKLKAIHQEEIGGTKRVLFSPFLKYAAAIVLLVSIASLSWIYFSSQSSYSNLYAENFEAYTNLLTVKGGGTSEEQSLVDAAMYQYDTKNYEKANLAFEELLKYKPDNDTILFYYGISSLGAEENELAISLFTQLLRQDESLFFRFGHAQWYLALAYIQEAGNIEDSKLEEDKRARKQLVILCKEILTEIVEEQGDYAVAAQKIIDKLD